MGKYKFLHFITIVDSTFNKTMNFIILPCIYNPTRFKFQDKQPSTSRSSKSTSDRDDIASGTASGDQIETTPSRTTSSSHSRRREKSGTAASAASGVKHGSSNSKHKKSSPSSPGELSVPRCFIRPTTLRGKG